MILTDKLFEAIEKNDLKSLKELIQSGADLNSFNKEDKTPLMHASDLGLAEVVQLLIESGADVNKSTDFGKTALSYALCGQSRNLKTVQTLVENGADIHNQIPKKDGFYTLYPLTQAVLYSNVQVVSYLLGKGAKGKEEALQVIRHDERENFLNMLTRQPQEKKSGLQTFFKQMIFRLIDKLFEFERKDELSLMNRIEQGRDITPCLKEFLLTGNVKESKLLHWAVRYNNLKLVTTLINSGFDVNGVCIGDRTPLKYAVWNDNLKAAQILIQNGADVHFKDRFGETVLHTAVRGHNKKMGELLLKSGANINQESGRWFFQTPLMIAADDSDLKMVQFLIEKGADVNMISSDGKTALSYALMAGKKANIKILEALIQAGADTNKMVCFKDNYFATPIEIATRYQDEAAVKFFLKQNSYGKEASFFIAQKYKNKRLMQLLSETKNQSFQRNN